MPRLLTPELLRRTIDLTQAALLDVGLAHPRIAIAALNPHAGEGGLFGRQDIDISTPVIEACRAEPPGHHRPGAGRHGVRQAARRAI